MRLHSGILGSLLIPTIVSLILFISSCDTTNHENDLISEVDTIHILSEIKLQLTRKYSLINYGIETYKLDTPRMIVVHYTAIPTLEETVALFRRDSISGQRNYIKQFSSLNVGIHYIVDKDGSIFKLLPDSIIARHVIGFNHVALGIENIGADSTELTEAQIQSNIELIHFLSTKYPTIKYLIGHSEYNHKDLPHFELFTSVDSTYIPYDKPDPGQSFLTSIRRRLEKKYGLVFQR